MTLYLHPHPDDFWEPRTKHPQPIDCIKRKAKGACLPLSGLRTK